MYFMHARQKLFIGFPGCSLRNWYWPSFQAPFDLSQNDGFKQKPTKFLGQREGDALQMRVPKETSNSLQQTNHGIRNHMCVHATSFAELKLWMDQILVGRFIPVSTSFTARPKVASRPTGEEVMGRRQGSVDIFSVAMRLLNSNDSPFFRSTKKLDIGALSRPLPRGWGFQWKTRLH